MDTIVNSTETTVADENLTTEEIEALRELLATPMLPEVPTMDEKTF
ncbi:hypothetical protein [Trueperella abortisuis]|nr:hypothetical protein [Trueperella abortisuis]